MLIASQKPNATRVAGFRTWNQLGRSVKKGEKGIVILAPMLRGKEEQNEEPGESTSAVAGFRAAYVFDITQTDGKELPAIGTVHGDPKDCTLQLQAFAEARGISVEYSDQIAPARGVSYGGKVVLLPGQTAAEEFFRAKIPDGAGIRVRSSRAKRSNRGVCQESNSASNDPANSPCRSNRKCAVSLLGSRAEPV
jgi:hypothetical protein